MFDRLFEKSVAITGIGQSEVGRPSSRSAMRLTLDAALEAIADAGLTREDIDGVACWPGDNNNGNSFSPVGPNALLSALGPEGQLVRRRLRRPRPAGRRDQRRDGHRRRPVPPRAGVPHHHRSQRARLIDKTAAALTNKSVGPRQQLFWQWYTPFNVLSAVNLMAMYAQRHFHEYGTTPEQLAQIALTCRRNAALNPKAVFRTPMTHGRLHGVEDDLDAAAHVRLRRALRRLHRHRAVARRRRARRPATRRSASRRSAPRCTSPGRGTRSR